MNDGLLSFAASVDQSAEIEFAYDDGSDERMTPRGAHRNSGYGMAVMSFSFRTSDYSFNFIHPDNISDPIDVCIQRGVPLSTGGGLQDCLVLQRARPEP